LRFGAGDLQLQVVLVEQLHGFVERDAPHLRLADCHIHSYDAVKQEQTTGFHDVGSQNQPSREG
jgi:hypothetical protein